MYKNNKEMLVRSNFNRIHKQKEIINRNHKYVHIHIHIHNHNHNKYRNNNKNN